MEVSACPGPETLALLSDGLLDDRARLRLTAHFDQCPDCAMMMVAIGESHPDDDNAVDGGGAWLVAGDRIGRYVVREWLGRGGMGQVYVAADPQLGREVAIKLVGTTSDNRAQRRLLREAQAMAKLAHHNVVRVYDAGLADGRAFIAMERVHGMSLDSWTANHKPNWRTVVSIYVRAGRGLNAAHQAGVLHRDFKPSNVFVRDDGQVLVADFGLARLFGERKDLLSASTLPFQLSQPTTNLSIAAGTPGYIAPETLGGTATEKSDQFSFAVSLENSLRKATSGLGPKRLERIIKRARAGNPANRFPSMDALLARLEAVRRPRWPKVAAASSVLAIAAAATAYFSLRSPPSLAELCGTPDERVQQVWNQDRRDAVESWFGASKHPFAAETRDKFVARAEAFAQDYKTSFRSICSATHTDETQSVEMLNLRLDCIDARLKTLETQIEQTISTDALTTDRALIELHSIPPLSSCDPKTVVSGVLPPPPPERAATIESLNQKIRDALALYSLDRTLRANEILSEIREAVTDASHPPLSAWFRLAKAEVSLVAGNLESARENAWGAMHSAQPLGWSSATARAAAVLGQLASLNNDPREARRWIQFARHTAETVGPNAPGLLTILGQEGEIEFKLGAFTEALVINRRARDLASVLFGELSPRTLVFDLSIATCLGSLGDVDEAAKILQPLLPKMVQSVGFHHSVTAQARTNLAVSYARLGDHSQAIRVFKEAVASLAAVYGEDSASVTHAEIQLANSLSQAGKEKEARQQFVSLSQRASLSTIERASVALYFGGHLSQLSASSEAVIQLEKAVMLYAEAVPETHVQLNYARLAYGQALMTLERPRDALPVLRAAALNLGAILPEDNRHLYAAIMDLAAAEILSGVPKAGLEVLVELEARAKALPKAEDRGYVLAKLAQTYALAQRRPESQALAEQALATLANTDENRATRKELEAMLP